MNDLLSQAGKWKLVETVVTAPNGSVAQLIPANSNRWAFAVSSPNGSTVISPNTPSGGFAGTTGITVGSGNPLVIRYADWGGFSQSRWNITSSGPAVTVTVYEMIMIQDIPESET